MDKQPHNRRVGDGDHRNEYNGPFHPLILSRPVIESHHRLRAVRQAINRHGNDFPDRVDHGHDPYVQIPAVMLQ